jgi:protease stability complex PrcB-like protein
MAAGALATVLIVSAVCGGPRGPMDVGELVRFADEGATEFSGYDGREPKIEMEKRGGAWFVTLYQGQQPSGGYGIRVERAIHVGTGVRLRARFTTPPTAAGVPAVTTSPAHTISFPFGADGFTLYDQNDQKRAELITP